MESTALRPWTFPASVRRPRGEEGRWGGNERGDNLGFHGLILPGAPMVASLPGTRWTGTGAASGSSRRPNSPAFLGVYASRVMTSRGSMPRASETPSTTPGSLGKDPVDSAPCEAPRRASAFLADLNRTRDHGCEARNHDAAFVPEERKLWNWPEANSP